MATVAMLNSLHALMTLVAISPLFAMSTFLNIILTKKMQLHFLANAIPPPVPLHEGDRGRRRQIWLSKYSHTLRGMHRFCLASFSLSLAEILRLSRKIKTKCIFRVNDYTDFEKRLH